jgi:cytochrome c biogenesis protein CcmG/thiol:disulfide interchange protein DsbE
MAALEAGVMAPDFSLPTLEGKQVSLNQMLQRGPVVLAFFKVSCPVCQYAFPFYERIAQAYKDAGVRVLGISQNNAAEAKRFSGEYGVNFPIAIDDEANHYAVSSAYGLTNVPTLLFIAQSGVIEVSSVGWSKSEMEDVNARLASYCNDKPSPLWRVGEEVPAFRAG